MCIRDRGNGAFEVVERTAAPRTGYVFGFAGTDASCLQDTESRGVYNLVVYRLIAFLAGLVEKENTCLLYTSWRKWLILPVPEIFLRQGSYMD